MSLPEMADCDVPFPSGLVLIDFYATWCGPCRLLAPMLEVLYAEFYDIKPSIIFRKWNVETKNPPVTVSALPTLVLFRDGVEISRQVGLMSKPALKGWLLSQSKGI